MNVRDIMKKFEECKTPLNYEGFEKYYIKPTKSQWKVGQHWIFRFENDYGASVIKHYGSYGFEEDLFELAVIYFPEKGADHFGITYNTSITNDVIGCLSNDDVLEYLQRISELNDAGK